MKWIESASEQLQAELDPAYAIRKQQIADLQAAGVQQHTIDTLFPPQNFPHVAVVKQLVYEPSFSTHARTLVSEISVREWLNNLPQASGTAISAQLRVSYFSASVNFYDSTDPQNWHLLMQLDSRHEATLKPLAETLLLLPLALTHLARISPEDFEQSWQQEQWEQKSESARRPLRNLLALVKVQMSVPEPGDPGG